MDKPILEDIWFGENPKNFPTQEHAHYPIEQCEPLPSKYLEKLPEYIKLFCLPVINPKNEIQFNIDLTEDFLAAYRMHYKLTKNPSQDKIMETLEAELKMALKGFF